jgi:Ca2+-transporting ATPase
MEALKNIIPEETRVIRDRKNITNTSTDLVPVMSFCSKQNRIPADVRFIETHQIERINAYGRVKYY